MRAAQSPAETKGGMILPNRGLGEVLRLSLLHVTTTIFYYLGMFRGDSILKLVHAAH